MNNTNITYRRNARAKQLQIAIHPNAEVIVTVPRQLSMSKAEEYVQTRRAWIQKHLDRIRDRQQKRESLPDLSPEQLDAAQDDLFARLEAFSRKYDLPYRRATFRCQKTKWGSCSSAGNLSLNVNIAFLPRHLQDYLLLHELCHIRHHDHSKEFWVLLDKLCGQNAKQLAKELKQYPMKLRR